VTDTDYNPVGERQQDRLDRSASVLLCSRGTFDAAVVSSGSSLNKTFPSFETGDLANTPDAVFATRVRYTRSWPPRGAMG